MKSLRILFSVLFVMSLATACDDGGKKTTKSEICNDNIDNDGDGRVDCFDTDCATAANCQTVQENCTNGVDDDGDGLVDCLDTADCGTHASCQTAQENCTNGIDDDGDGQIDCNDSDCSTHASCQTSNCTENSIFFDSPQTCQTGYTCGLNDQMQATCLPDSAFAGGTFYGACGGNGECPKGSGCFNIDGGMCAPYCSDTHLDCPTGGACYYGIEGSDTLGLCGPTDNCDPVAGTGCTTAGDGCFFVGVSDAGLCDVNGTSATGAACSAWGQCAAGNICANIGQGNQCIKLCRGAGDCAAGSCQSVGQNGLPAGVGICM
jgi:hypothetical protein